jgi:hypothetical protein
MKKLIFGLLILSSYSGYGQEAPKVITIGDYTIQISKINAITDLLVILDSKKNILCTKAGDVGERFTDITMPDFVGSQKRVFLTTWSYDRTDKYIVFDTGKGKDCVVATLQERELEDPEFDHVNLKLIGSTEDAKNSAKIKVSEIDCAYEKHDKFKCKKKHTKTSTENSQIEGE